jgi:hypothetical protein
MKKNLLLILSFLLIIGVLGFSIRSPGIKQSKSTYNIPDTPEAKEIMRTVDKAYDIEAEAAYTFDLKKFPTVFINDPRFPVSPGTLKTIRQLTNNPSLESAGWLDYKIAYYSWSSGAILKGEELKKKAKSENRSLTEEEKQSLTDPQGRTAPARPEGSIRKNPVMFISMDINDDIAIVIVDDGPMTVRLTLVSVDKQWYSTAYKGLSVHP